MRKSVFLLAVLMPTALVAEWEVTPFLGYRGGTFEFTSGVACIALVGVECPTFLESEDSLVFGALLDLPLRDRLDFELLINRQPTELQSHDGLGNRGGSNLPSFDLDLTHLHAGLRGTWPLRSFEPFGAFGLGATWLESDPLIEGEVDTARLSASLAAGLVVDLSERLGVRLEARQYWVDLPDSFTTFLIPTGRNLTQFEATTGLTVKF